MEHFDMVTIGSGPAGEKAAAQAAYFGHKVAVVDRNQRPGGAPVNSGGIPTKTLREAALYLTGFRKREIYGVGMGLGPDLMLDRLRSRAAEVQEARGAAVRQNLERHHIELIHGEGSLADHSVVVRMANGETRELGADVILIATGSRPWHPAGIPFDDPDVHDSDSILTLDSIPGRMLVVGGGPVGAEFASVFTALGVEVTMIDMANRLVPFLDLEVSEVLKGCLETEGIRVLLGVTATIERVDGRLEVAVAGGEILRPDAVLFAAGRVGNTEELGLSEAGVNLDERGRVLVDNHFQTSVPGVYAAGDVIGPPALASVSTEQGRVAACHAFGIPFKETLDPLPPYGIYSIPEVAMVGLTEEAARASGIDHEVGRAWFADNARSAIAGTQQGFVKLVFQREDRKLRGAHIVGEEATELIHQPQAVIHAGGTIDHFIDSTYNIPTRSEAFKYAAYDALQNLAAHD
jgi:NAD(P) transhydrogenase